MSKRKRVSLSLDSFYRKIPIEDLGAVWVCFRNARWGCGALCDEWKEGDPKCEVCQGRNDSQGNLIPGRVICPRADCHGEGKSASERRTDLNDNIRYECSVCRRGFNALSETPFQGTKKPREILQALHLMTELRSGIPVSNLAALLNVADNTMSYIVGAIGGAIYYRRGISALRGVVEIDFAHIGGLFKNMHAYRRDKAREEENNDKARVMVFIAAKRRKYGHNRALAIVVRPSPNQKEINALIRKWVTPNSVICTDQDSLFRGISKMEMGYKHKVVNHKKKQRKTWDGYSTNRVEGFVAFIKKRTENIIRREGDRWEYILAEAAFQYENCHQSTVNAMNAAIKASGKMGKMWQVIKDALRPRPRP